METPFPVEGTITPDENGYTASVPCETMWLTETENGDVLQQAVDRAAREHGVGTEVGVRFTARGIGGDVSFELLGAVDDENAGAEGDHEYEADETFTADLSDTNTRNEAVRRFSEELDNLAGSGVTDARIVLLGLEDEEVQVP